MSQHPRPATLDVSELPEVTFGHKSIAWWGTLLFMIIEGTTLAVCAATYLYLRKNYTVWPPAIGPLPSPLLPTVNTVLLLLVMVPMALADRAAKRLDRSAVLRWLLVATMLSLAATVLRWWDFEALNVRWDRNAYGSAAWATVGFHATLLVVDLLETATIAAIFLFGPLEEKHFSDASDAAFYQYFLSLSWVPLYVLIYLSPRWM